MSGLLYQIREEFGDEVCVCRGDVLRNPVTMSGLGVRSIPTVQIHHQGRRVGSWSNQISVQQIFETLDALLPED